MSAIGNYVHLTYSGYVEKTGAKKSPYFDNFGNSIDKKQRKFDNWINKQNTGKILNQLEKETNKALQLLKRFKDSKGNRDHSMNAEEQLYINTLLEDLWAQLETKYLRIDKIRAASAGLIQSGGYYLGKYTGEEKASQTLQVQSIHRINQQLQDLLNNTLQNLSSSLTNLTQDDLMLKDIKQEVKITQQNIDNFINQLQIQNKSFNSSDLVNASQQLNGLFQNLANKIKNIDLYKNIDIESEINNLADDLYLNLSANQYKGDISEALIATIAQRMSAVAGSNIEKAIVSGNERSQRGIDTSFFDSSINWEAALEGKKFKQPYGDFIVSADSVQDKVDVKIETSKGRHAYISAKNYNLKSLSRGATNKSASFLTLIQNENEDDFINHYLNLNAVHGNWRSLRPSANTINDLLKKITMAKLITGYNTVTGANGATMDSANVFAIFNSDTYEVKYYNMEDVLKGVMKSMRYQMIKIPTFFYDSNWKQVEANIRISNLIRQLNTSVSYTLLESDYKNK